MCESDPRSPAVGNYMMTDSIFFLGVYNETIEYEFAIELDSLEGDTIILNNFFGGEYILDVRATFDSATGDFEMLPTQDGAAVVTGSGNITSNTLNYTAAYDDGGLSFKGSGTKQ